MITEYWKCLKIPYVEMFRWEQEVGTGLVMKLAGNSQVILIRDADCLNLEDF